jgi:hypothetical protein
MAKGRSAVPAMVVDADGEAARRLYLAHGFLPPRDRPMRLFLPLASLAI